MLTDAQWMEIMAVESEGKTTVIFLYCGKTVEPMQRWRTKPNATIQGGKREQEISNLMVGNKITAHITKNQVSALVPIGLSNKQTQDGGKASRSTSYHERKK